MATVHDVDVQNNADARRAARLIDDLAVKALTALGEFDLIRAQLVAYARSIADQMHASGHDKLAAAAAASGADVLATSLVAEEHARLEEIHASAQAIIAALTKYLDAEDLIASRGASAATLSTSNS